MAILLNVLLIVLNGAFQMLIAFNFIIFLKISKGSFSIENGFYAIATVPNLTCATSSYDVIFLSTVTKLLNLTDAAMTKINKLKKIEYFIENGSKKPEVKPTLSQMNQRRTILRILRKKTVNLHQLIRGKIDSTTKTPKSSPNNLERDSENEFSSQKGKKRQKFVNERDDLNQDKSSETSKNNNANVVEEGGTSEQARLDLAKRNQLEMTTNNKSRSISQQQKSRDMEEGDIMIYGCDGTEFDEVEPEQKSGKANGRSSAKRSTNKVKTPSRLNANEEMMKQIMLELKQVKEQLQSKLNFNNEVVENNRASIVDQEINSKKKSTIIDQDRVMNSALKKNSPIVKSPSDTSVYAPAGGK